ncbi:sensor domain-containing protein [Nocardia sp. CDC159]|uniref:histidine kinase n=1 Tax=Nocardia pulmonis TaxID=2951408 RepID=A0A9X2EDA5_9NOCA|nr:MULTISPECIES: sensor domain-containing protein [Nocardia]MCM6777315.1 sensor domain-containing protein [Nocardia pulmonis]MCM6790200.1 sensor domain-containing protein [Nocardia sp. CDC159]
MTETFAQPTVALEPGEPAATRVIRAVLRAPFEARTWRELAYLIVAAPLGFLAMVYVLVAYPASLAPSIFLLGIPTALVLLSGRVWGRVYRALAAKLLATPMPAPPPFAPRPGLFGWFRSVLTDVTSWRALVFLVGEVALGLFGGYFVLVVIAMMVFTAISVIPWALFHPINVDPQGVERHSLAQFGDFYIDTWPRALGLSALGVLACFALPWLIRGMCWLHRVLALALLTPTGSDRRVAELRESRRAAVDNSAATLRRLERDLHDGTQARLVTIAMTLGRAEERIAEGTDATELIADARASSKEALTELRELVRGIHPPALELGLEPALETLAARCAVPVELRVLLPQRPSPAIEAIAYFSVAELLTNVVKHSGADRAWVSVLPAGPDTMMVGVRDNGRGGALQPTESNGNAVVAGGLSGLAARARSVDGTLTVDSPVGGPTVITMTLPIAGPQ